MSLPGRSGRRGGAGFRWVSVGVVITLLVLLIDASLNSRSPSPQESLAAGAWVDRVLPVIATSNAEGREMAAVWSANPATPAAQRQSSMDDISAGATRAYATVTHLQPPSELAGAAGLLDAALLARSRAATGLDKALAAALGPAGVSAGTAAAVSAGGSTARPTTTTTITPTAVAISSVVPAVTAAGSEIQVGDQAYQLFRSSVPASLGVQVPASAWAADPAPYTAQGAEVFLTTLQNSVTTSPVYQARIYGISTTPGPVGQNGTTEIVPDASTLTLDVVIANTGNQSLNNLTVTASLSPAAGGSSSVRDFVNLAVGQAYTIQGMGPLTPRQGVPVTLTVTVSPQSGPLQAPSQTIVFEMPGATPLTTTTTAPPAPPSTTTTTPGSPTSSTTTGAATTSPTS